MFLVALSEYDQVLVESDYEVIIPDFMVWNRAPPPPPPLFMAAVPRLGLQGELFSRSLPHSPLAALLCSKTNITPLSPLFPKEPDGGEHGAVPDHHHLPVVQTHLRHLVPQQDRPAEGESHVLTLGRLLP